MEKGFNEHVAKLRDDIEKNDAKQEKSTGEKIKDMLSREGLLILSGNNERRRLANKAWIEEGYAEGKKSLTLRYINENGEVFEYYEFNPQELGISFESLERISDLQIAFREAGIDLLEKDDFKISEVKADIKDNNRKIKSGEKIDPSLYKK